MIGEWLVSPYGVWHYYLDGAPPLCGRLINPAKDQPKLPKDNGCKRQSSYCPNCRDLNWDRWAAVPIPTDAKG